MSHSLMLECPRCAQRRADAELLGHLLLDHQCTVREALVTLVEVRPAVMA